MAENPVTVLSIIERIFSNWTALKMAVEHGNGTIDSARGFSEYIAKTLSMNEKLHYTDISGLLEEVMDEDFHTILEDESEKQVAEDVVRFHNYIIANDVEKLTSELQKLPPVQPWILPNQNFKLPQISKIKDNSDSDNEDNEIGNSKGIATLHAEMEVDSEKWSVIRRKNK